MIGTSQELIKYLLKQDKDKVFKISEHKGKRSLKANAYCWELINKIADVIGSTKIEVYRECVKAKGVFRVITMNKEAVPTFKKVWEAQGIAWICETNDTLKGNMIEVIAYYGTSSYNSKQMANFIDYVVQEAKNLDIETLPPDEIAKIKSLWQ